MILLLLKFVDLAFCDCSRSSSRIARNIFKQKIEVIYNELGLQAPISCPFHFENDIFGIQELYASGSANRWTCHLCGKTFFDVFYLDRHFDLKHSNQLLKGENARCLADLCDWIRCDVVSGKVVSQFWDFALCHQSSMSVLKAQCMSALKLCIPTKVNATLHDYLLAQVNQSVCAYLACDQYWDEDSHKDQMSSLKIVVVTLFSVCLLVGLLGYYYVACTYFLTESYDSEKTELSNEFNMRYSKRNNLRHRQSTL